ncbi:putative NADH oxidase [Podospora didyma]|uniref:NADH oxidase n=1 Tax=Podospora didyma TaxID=330526 RepID=A0AAE0K6D4_9PEZI|nr:putative NADH oxidase [Podospora didyma]
MMAARYLSPPGFDPSPLATPLPFHFSDRTSPNRFMKAAMTEYLATWHPTDPSQRGIPDSRLINLYSAWAAGGFGLVITGNIIIDPSHLEKEGNMIIPLSSPFSGPRFSGFSSLASSTKKSSSVGSLLLGQLNHPGRQTQSKYQPDPVSASDVHLDKVIFGSAAFSKPHPASLDEIAHIVESFIYAAVYLEQAGWDGVELHAAHGYLLAQFLSETTNRRTDAYGGSLVNRARIITEIAAGMKERTKKGFILGIKINSVEFQEHGFTVDDAAELCELLERNGFDFVELSGGTYEDMGLHHRRESTRAREAFFLDFAERIVPKLKDTKVIVTGGLRSAGAMVDALRTVDGVGLGRPACTEPDLPRGILEGRVEGCLKAAGLDEDDFGATAGFSALQMRLLAMGREPLDPSREEEMKSLLSWGRMLDSLAAGENFVF